MENKIDSLNFANAQNIPIGNDVQDNVLNTNDIGRKINVVDNANAPVSEKIALFDQMVVELPHREVVKWYEDNVKDMSLEEIKHMQSKVYPCIRFDAKKTLNDVRSKFGEKISFAIHETNWSGIKEVDVTFMCNDITDEDIRWFAYKVKEIPLSSLTLIGVNLIREMDLSIFTVLYSVSFKCCDSLEIINGLDKSHDLRMLYVENCSDLKKINELDKCKCLKILSICNASLLHDFPDLSSLSNLVRLELKNCVSIKSLKGVFNLRRLRKLSFINE